ncbi:hypothetical protein LTR17_008479 [Elasticomyces elasticus]|nr:hypothetical protein LTR17_008479 [Elasticomyces elasticus]
MAVVDGRRLGMEAEVVDVEEEITATGLTTGTGTGRAHHQGIDEGVRVMEAEAGVQLVEVGHLRRAGGITVHREEEEEEEVVVADGDAVLATTALAVAAGAGVEIVEEGGGRIALLLMVVDEDAVLATTVIAVAAGAGVGIVEEGGGRTDLLLMAIRHSQPAIAHPRTITAWTKSALEDFVWPHSTYA